MQERILFFSTAAFLLFYFSACNSGGSSSNKAIPSDAATIAKGEGLFNQYCASCHNFMHGGFGPSLGGLTDSVPADWIKAFIRDPKKIIESGDKRAQQLFKKYKVAMPSFAAFTDDEVNEIIAYLSVDKSPGQYMDGDGKALSNPIPDSIKLSNLIVGLEFVTQIPPSIDSNKFPLARITKLDFQPTTGHIFILDLRGKLYRLQGNRPVVYMDMAKLKPAFIHEIGLGTGFGSFAFHPDFAKNGLLYTTHAEAPGSGQADFAYADSIKVTLQYVLTEWKAENPSQPTFSGTSRELFRVNMMSVMHGIQEITFNPLVKHGHEDYGKLYIGMADGGTVAEGYPFLTHNLEKIWGTILRIDPLGRNSLNGRYGIPPNNPFVQNQNPKTLGEIYAYGFKNPHRITWSQSGQMIVCNIGQEYIESVNIVMAGHDYGWPVREGTFVMDPYGDLKKIYPLPSNDSIYKITYPVAQYDHEVGWTAISGGYEYSGTTIPQLKGKFLFGDIPSGRLFYIDMADVTQGKQAPIQEWKTSFNGKPKTLAELCGNDRVEMRMGRDARGELYVLSKADGKVYKLVSAMIKPSIAQ